MKKSNLSRYPGENLGPARGASASAARQFVMSRKHWIPAGLYLYLIRGRIDVKRTESIFPQLLRGYEKMYALLAFIS